ncbi:MAG TPA: hypothetical protein VFJ43_06640 [Bacteroidia bacterium]|nr:hypothetical protein [Bacteroidia bacterium]
MNLTHLHLALSHLVVMAVLFSAVLFLFGFFRKNETIKKLALFGFVIAALSAIPVFLAGESAEESVEHLTGVSESVIDSHEDAATFSFWMIEIAGAVALGALFLKKIPAFKNSFFTGIMVLISLVSAGAISYTGYLGGQIRHTEISGNSVFQNGGQNGEQGEAGADQDDN